MSRRLRRTRKTTWTVWFTLATCLLGSGCIESDAGRSSLETGATGFHAEWYQWALAESPATETGTVVGIEWTVPPGLSENSTLYLEIQPLPSAGTDLDAWGVLAFRRTPDRLRYLGGMVSADHYRSDTVNNPTTMFPGEREETVVRGTTAIIGQRVTGTIDARQPQYLWGVGEETPVSNETLVLVFGAKGNEGNNRFVFRPVMQVNPGFSGETDVAFEGDPDSLPMIPAIGSHTGFDVGFWNQDYISGLKFETFTDPTIRTGLDGTGAAVIAPVQSERFSFVPTQEEGWSFIQSFSASFVAPAQITTTGTWYGTDATDQMQTLDANVQGIVCVPGYFCEAPGWYAFTEGNGQATGPWDFETTVAGGYAYLLHLIKVETAPLETFLGSPGDPGSTRFVYD